MKTRLSTLSAAFISMVSTNVLADPTHNVTTVPMQLNKYGHVYVSAQINDRVEQAMILDTAATAGVIPKSWFNELNIAKDKLFTEETQGAVGKVTLTKAELNNTQIAEAQVSDLGYVVQDMSSLALPDGRIPGIIGKGFLENYCTVFDFKNKQVTFAKNGCPNELVSELKVSEFWLEDGMIKLNTRFSGEIIEAILDTGSPVNILNPALLAKVDTEQLEKKELKGLNNHGVTKQKLGNVSFHVGENLLTSVKNVASDLPVFHALGYKDKPVLLMGLSNFTNNKLVVDYTTNKIYF
ncbi:aspartyl protease family protein [Thalassotalea marina]|uniref:Peptidase A2 domain-containing protein n=1 Tax=Thalassotalea marina TaxID=1673741 RepID=A0A919BLA9_9GAMM|nr:aspartyl protease family protein [Thalassotalea marina]GHF97874.1 hypothetical protein GCM10017161_27720 [Thalassotalea marina]